MTTPLVSVIIPVYNVEKYVGSCLDSMISQTYSNLEIWIVDDASTDGTIEEVSQFNDSRIQILQNKTNLGLAASVNRAILQAKGKYIARMDGDDRSMPTRIEKQVKFLEHHSNISILGSAMQSFGQSNYAHYFPPTHAACKARLLFNVCFGHPTVLIRKTVFDDPRNFYKEELQQYSEEYELWCRLVDNYQFANLEEVLVMYRTFPPSSRCEAAAKRKENSFVIRKNFIRSQWGNQSESDYQCHDHVCNLSQGNRPQLGDWIDWLEKMKSLNLEQGAFEVDALSKELSKRYFELLYVNRHLGIRNLLKWYINNGNLQGHQLSWQQHTKFILRSLLNT